MSFFGVKPNHDNPVPQLPCSMLHAPCSVFDTMPTLAATYRPTGGMLAGGENAVIRAEYCPELEEAPP